MTHPIEELSDVAESRADLTMSQAVSAYLHKHVWRLSFLSILRPTYDAIEPHIRAHALPDRRRR